MTPRSPANRLSVALLLAVALLLVPGPPAAAQVLSASTHATPDTCAAGPAPPALDRRLLLAVYQAESPVATATMRAADAAAYPLFVGVPAAAWGAALARDANYDEAYRLTLAEGLALGAALGLKKAFSRARPYHTLPAVRSRSERYRRGQEGHFAGAFPSGHAAAAFALATSWSLSHPAWYVVGPSVAGATLISASRLWLGVHYPSDVLAGAFLGASAAVGVHLLRGVLTPGLLNGEESAASGPMVRLRVRLP